ncbi:MAG: hypothetical protein WCJ39_07485 [bacterium]
MRPVDLTNIIAIVIGLRMAHAAGSPFKKGEEILIQKMKITDGKIEELQFEVQNKESKQISVPEKNQTTEDHEMLITDPKSLLALPEEEMKIVLEKEVNEIKEELKNINSETTAEQKLAIIKKVEMFFNKIRDMLSEIKEHYQTVK